MTAGKGDTYRKVDRRKYDATWLRLHGVTCPRCGGSGYVGVRAEDDAILDDFCPLCDGHGRVDPRVRKRWLRENR